MRYRAANCPTPTIAVFHHLPVQSPSHQQLCCLRNSHSKLHLSISGRAFIKSKWPFCLWVGWSPQQGPRSWVFLNLFCSLQENINMGRVTAIVLVMFVVAAFLYERFVSCCGLVSAELKSLIIPGGIIPRGKVVTNLKLTWKSQREGKRLKKRYIS